MRCYRQSLWCTASSTPGNGRPRWTLLPEPPDGRPNAARTMERRASPPVPPPTTLPNRSLIGFHFFACLRAAGKRIAQLFPASRILFPCLCLRLSYTHQRVFGTGDKASRLARDNASVRRSSLGFRAPISLARAGSLATRDFMVAHFPPGARFAPSHHAGRRASRRRC